MYILSVWCFFPRIINALNPRRQAANANPIPTNESAVTLSCFSIDCPFIDEQWYARKWKDPLYVISIKWNSIHVPKSEHTKSDEDTCAKQTCCGFVSNVNQELLIAACSNIVHLLKGGHQRTGPWTVTLAKHERKHVWRVKRTSWEV